MRDGLILAGRAVRLACARHFHDLQRQGSTEFPFTFDPIKAQRILDFYPNFLTLENGNSFNLLPWQQFCLGAVFGWLKANGKRRFQTSYVETGKGSGKTPLLAGICLYGLAFDGEQSAEVYSAAFDRDQASIVLNDARRMAEAGELADMLTIGKYNIADESSGSFFRAVSSEHRSKSGPRPHIFAIDEMHEHRDGTVVNKGRAGFKGRTQPLIPVITNSGHDRTSICWTYHQHSLAVLEGQIQDEQWFAYVSHLDPCDQCFNDGYRQPKDGCAMCDDWTRPDSWLKANPSLGVTIQTAYLQTQVALALAMPSEQSLVKRLNFCIWTESHVVWIPTERWDACKVEHVSDGNPERRPCAAGLDLSSKIDLSSLVVAIRHDDPPGVREAETVEIAGKDDAGDSVVQSITLNFSIELVPWFWIPEETLIERVKTERIPYDVWKRAGFLEATLGNVIDHQAIYDKVVAIWKQYRVARMGYDPRDATMLAVNLRDRARLGDGIVEIGQGKKLSEAFKLIEVLIRSKRLKHNGHPVLAWNFANAEPKRDRLGALWIEKPSDTKRIDGVIAAAMAVHQLMVLPAKRTGAVGMFVV